MEKLVVKIIRFDNVLIGKIISQPEKLRGEKNISKHIYSECYPSLMKYSLFIRGSIKKEDDNVFVYTYDNKEEAIEVLNILRKEIVEINLGFGVNKPKDDSETYILE